MEGRKDVYSAVTCAGSCFFEFVSGEWMFRCGHPNGGTIIILRTVWVTAGIYLLGLGLRSYYNAGCPSCHFDVGALWEDGVTTVPWLGAIFGAVYAALYARFASQWSYLAGVYNQIRQMLATWKPSDGNVDHLFLWQAGFIEDALDLHLATKPMFATFIGRLLADHREVDGAMSMSAVACVFDDPNNTFNGRKRRSRLHKQLNKRFGIPIPPSVLVEARRPAWWRRGRGRPAGP